MNWVWFSQPMRGWFSDLSYTNWQNKSTFMDGRKEGQSWDSPAVHAVETIFSVFYHHQQPSPVPAPAFHFFHSLQGIHIHMHLYIQVYILHICVSTYFCISPTTVQTDRFQSVREGKVLTCRNMNIPWLCCEWNVPESSHSRSPPGGPTTGCHTWAHKQVVLWIGLTKKNRRQRTKYSSLDTQNSEHTGRQLWVMTPGPQMVPTSPPLLLLLSFSSLLPHDEINTHVRRLCPHLPHCLSLSI